MYQQMQAATQYVMCVEVVGRQQEEVPGYCGEVSKSGGRGGAISRWWNSFDVLTRGLPQEHAYDPSPPRDGH